MSALKVTSADQHLVLHQRWPTPTECCLCRSEAEIERQAKEIERLEGVRVCGGDHAVEHLRDDCCPYCEIDALRARVAVAEKACNICGEEWPHHAAACVYKQTAARVAALEEAGDGLKDRLHEKMPPGYERGTKTWPALAREQYGSDVAALARWREVRGEGKTVAGVEASRVLGEEA